MFAREMGRPSPERRQAKRQKQKVRRKLTYRTQTPHQIDYEINTEPYNSKGGGQPESTTTDYYIVPMGGADTGLVEMDLYDIFREQDGQPFSLSNI